MYLSQLSISFLAQAILALAFSLYLISRQYKTRPTVWLTLSMVGTAGFFGSRFIYKSLSPYSAWQPSALFLQYLFVPLLIVPLVLFAYEFPQTLARQDKERKVATILAVAGGLVTILATVQLAFFQIQSIHGLYINSYILLGNLWVMLVLLRRTPALAAATDLRSWWAKLWRPQNWAAQGARAFGLAVGLIVSATLPSILSEAGLLSRALANSIQTVLTLTAVFAFTIVYLNYAPEPTTIAAKLVGFTLFTVLTMLGVLSFVVAPFYERAYLNETLPIPPQMIQFTPNAQAGYDIAAIDHPFNPELGQDLALGNNTWAEVTLPFAFPFYGQARTDLYVSDNGIVTFDSPFYHRATQFGQQPAVVPLLLDLDPAAGGGVFVNQTAVSSTITWHDIPGKNGTAPNTIQLTLYPDGRIIFGYLALAPDPVYGTDLLHGPSLTGLHPGRTSQQPEIIRFTEDLPYSSPAQTAVWEPYQTDFRSYLHQRMLPLAYLVLAASLLVIVAIPLFFQASLLRPLRSLVAGIEQVNQGDLTVTVPVRFNDEIGFVTESFNGMVDSLKQSDQLKDEFLANTSHELRTPLNGIVGLTESLLAGDAGSLSAIQMQHLAMIASSGRRLTSLVNDILDFS
ncbi:MAG: HAMP domain-containing sensor histidine kinase, partial [Chloroflexota bacterium]